MSEETNTPLTPLDMDLTRENTDVRPNPVHPYANLKLAANCRQIVSALDVVMTEVIHLLQTDTVPRFCRTDIFKQLYC